MLRTLAICFLLISSSNAYSQYCDIRDFKTHINYRRDLLTNLSYFDQVSSRLDRNDAANTSLNFLELATLNSDQASNLSSSLQRILDIKWTQHDQEWLLIAALDASGSQAYYQCLERNRANLWLKLGEGAGGKLQFLVDMQWRPTYNAPNPSKIKYRLLNAKLTGDAPTTIRPGASDQFGIERIDPYKPVEIGVRVDDQTYPSISLPEFPEKKLDNQIREVKEYHDVYGGGVDYITRLCIDIPNSEQDAVIVPNTLDFSTIGLVADRGSLSELPGTSSSILKFESYQAARSSL